MNSGARDRAHVETFTGAVHEAEEGGYRAEVLELPGCASRGESLDEPRAKVIDALEGCVGVHAEDHETPEIRTVTTMSVRVPVPD